VAKLAIDGGPPVCGGKTWPRYLLGTAEREAAMAVIDRNITQGRAFDRYGGEEVDAYEREFAAFGRRKHATAVSSGTAAIHSILGALHLEPGSEVICSPITDPGAVMPVVFQLCIPVFADTAPDSFNSCAAGVARVLSPRTGAILLGHIAGEPLDIEPVAALARTHNIPLIEDCAQAHGAEYRDCMVGTFGTAAAFSTMSGKHHTSGGQGGMILTDDEALCLEAKRFADRGKPFGSNSPTNLFLGLNYRMTELQAAIGRVQLRKLPAIVQRRRDLAERLRAHLRDAGVAALRLPEPVPGAKPAWWFLRVAVDENRLKVPKAQLAAALRAEGVPAAATYTTLIYEQRWFRERATFGTSGIPWTLPRRGRRRKYVYEHCCPNAERALATHILVGFHESMPEEAMDLFAEAMLKVEKAYLR